MPQQPEGLRVGSGRREEDIILDAVLIPAVGIGQAKEVAGIILAAVQQHERLLGHQGGLLPAGGGEHVGQVQLEERGSGTQLHRPAHVAERPRRRCGLPSSALSPIIQQLLTAKSLWAAASSGLLVRTSWREAKAA